jgi:phosphoribosylformimino-5-aminoimidazole carboxamide ribonucleotide (ProFAR) isomerase
MFQLIGNGKTYAEVRDYIVNEFKSKGFTNITVNDLTGSDNPDNVNQIKSISPSADGTIAALNTAITITIFRAS